MKQIKVVNVSQDTATFHIDCPIISVMLMPGKSLTVDPGRIGMIIINLVNKGVLQLYEEDTATKHVKTISPTYVPPGGTKASHSIAELARLNAGGLGRPVNLTNVAPPPLVEGPGPLGFRCFAYILCIKDDLCLKSVVRRLYSEGVLDVHIFIPDQYFSGVPAPIEDMEQVRKVALELGAIPHIIRCAGIVGDRPTVETAIRNRGYEMVRKDYDWCFIVDADELWFNGTGRILADVIHGHPLKTQIEAEVIPYVGVPAYPVGENSDMFLMAMKTTEQFVNIRTSSPQRRVTIHKKLMHHFTAVRKSEADVAHKMRASGHYGDPAYDFEKWIKETLPKLKPGYKGSAHMYQGGGVWNGVRMSTAKELEDIPREVIPYMGAEAHDELSTWCPRSISLLAPSRWRPKQCIENLTRWLKKAKRCVPIEVIVALDNDDETMPQYVEAIDSSGFSGQIQIRLGDHRSVTQAINTAAMHSNGGVLISVFDDFDCPEGWDEQVLLRLEEKPGKALFIYDGQWPASRVIQTMSIVTRDLYEEWGYFWYPQYLGMWSDNDYTEKCLLEGRAIWALDLTFKHNHFTSGASKIDRTYEHGNKNDKYQFGEALMNRRRAAKFATL